MFNNNQTSSLPNMAKRNHQNNLLHASNQMSNMNMSYYKGPEENADVPTMILSPVIMNDNRLLMISTMGVSYLMHTPSVLKTEKPEIDAIDFHRKS